MDEKYWPVSTVSRRLDVSPKTVRKLIKSGRLEAVKVGSRYRISSTAVEDFLGASTVEPDE
jgi:excisionase family DNA binding protein